MTLNEIFEQILLRSGQFLIKPDKIELNSDLFVPLVRGVLAVYSEYRPHTVIAHIDMSSTRQFTFTETTIEPEGIPDQITDVIPTRLFGSFPYHLRWDRGAVEGFASPGYGGRSSYLEIKSPLPWVYRKPELTTSIASEFEIHAMYFHTITSEEIENTTVYSVDTISFRDRYFFDLMLGRFMQALGRSRRAFTLNDLTITMDSGELVSEGQEIEQKALEDIENTSKFYLAWL